MRGKNLMLQGTGSSVGKSMLCCALLRILRQDGYHATPFKAQNMALNSYVTRDGKEMGRAQVTQAQAAGLEPDVLMNPVLLKPTSDKRSQVIVNGRAVGNMSAAEYHQYKPELREIVQKSYQTLEQGADYVVLEGAGSPAEINLRDGDIVNMAMAEMADAPVLLIGDINLGGVFASLYGTYLLLRPEEQARVRGIIINKFRGDVQLLKPGLQMLEDLIHVPVVGVVPWMDIALEDEDSVTERFRSQAGTGEITVVVVKLGHISNFTDFQPLTLQEGFKVRYADCAEDLAGADIIILPGTKNTIEDLAALRRKGMDMPILRHARAGGLVLGICGGYQMLGKKLHDPEHVESDLPEIGGLGLLDTEVYFHAEKKTVQAVSRIDDESGWLRGLTGALLDGYEIHAGANTYGPQAVPWLKNPAGGAVDGIRNTEGNVLGCYLHGLFDNGLLSQAILRQARIQKGLAATDTEAPLTMDAFREREFDRLADIVRASLDMEAIYSILRSEEA